jgi:RNA polymerase sigma factor (sigma-70 family)
MKRASNLGRTYYSGGLETQRLTAAEERSLFAELALNRDDPKVRERAVRAFLGFALGQAQKDFSGRTVTASLKCGLSMDDAISAANYGLMQALDRFDHTRGFRFTTYAGWWIKKALHEARYSAHAVTVTRSDREKFVLFGKQQRSGLSVAEIAALNDESEAEVSRVLDLAGGRQSTFESVESGHSSLAASPDEEMVPSVAVQVEHEELLALLEKAKMRLGSEELLLLHDRFYRKQTVKQIASKHGLKPRAVEEKLKTILHVLRFSIQAR